MLAKISCVILICFTFFSQHSYACSCAGISPILGISKQPKLVAVKILRYIEEGEIPGPEYDDALQSPLFMEVEIIRHFQGEATNGTLILQGDSGSDCRPYVTGFPIGTQWLLNYYLSAEFEHALLGGCQENLKIIDDAVEGFVRHRQCAKDDSTCISSHGLPGSGNDMLDQNKNIESFSLDEFDILQDGFYQGAQAVRDDCEIPYTRCNRRRTRYDYLAKTINIPYMDVSRGSGPILGQIGVALEAAPEVGSLMYRLTRLYFVSSED